MGRYSRRVVAVLVVCCVTVAVLAQTQIAAQKPPLPMTLRCGNFAGTYMAAPKWEATSDSSRGQEVLVEFRGAKEPARVMWQKNGETYYEIEGIGLSMRSGFFILVPEEEYVETYTYNAGSSELLFSATRSGSSTLPNAIKGLRGTCVGAAR